MRIILTALALTIVTSAPAAAQRGNAPAGFDFNACFNGCLQRGSSSASCQTGCSARAATLARIPAGTARRPNDDPRSPRYNDPEQVPPAW